MLFRYRYHCTQQNVHLHKKLDKIIHVVCLPDDPCATQKPFNSQPTDVEMTKKTTTVKPTKKQIHFFQKSFLTQQTKQTNSTNKITISQSNESTIKQTSNKQRTDTNTTKQK